MSSNTRQRTIALTRSDEEIRMMRIDEILAVTGFRSKRHLYTLIERGDFPRLLKLRPGGRASGLPAAAVHDFVRRMAIDPLSRPSNRKTDQNSVS